MILRVLVVLCWAARFAPALEPTCKPVEGDRILGRQLAEALPAFRALPPETTLANMPPPGSRRTFHVAELVSLAQRYSIPLDAPQEVCFEWSMEPLDRSRVLEAMRKSLANPQAHIEITETSLYPVPSGRLEFPREMLGRPASEKQENPALWRGEVIYGTDHRFAVWAKVRVTVPCERAFALESLRAGQVIASSQVRAEPGQCFPSVSTFGRLPLGSIVGMAPARPIAAGDEIRFEMLTRPNDVNRGDTVRVDVNSGTAHLAFVAKAESAGRTGDFIAVRNPSSNRTFQARVKDKDHVEVQVDSSGAGR